VAPATSFSTLLGIASSFIWLSFPQLYEHSTIFILMSLAWLCPKCLHVEIIDSYLLNTSMCLQWFWALDKHQWKRNRITNFLKFTM
jgi:hypothetical protein